MTEPSVCAVLLTANRPEMAKQAVECFRAQTYGNKRLLILNTGSTHVGYQDWATHEDGSIMELWREAIRGLTIGALRNVAVESTECLGADILMHWDDDDFSHPNRIAEQVQLLQSSGADCAGYNEMLFWRETPGEAWRYSNPNPSYALGTSLCFWRRTWENKPFEATSVGEDLRFITGLKVFSVSANTFERPVASQPAAAPMMIARIHSGNTSSAYRADAMQRESERRTPAWRRVPEWDKFCQEQFAK